MLLLKKMEKKNVHSWEVDHVLNGELPQKNGKPKPSLQNIIFIIIKLTLHTSQKNTLSKKRPPIVCLGKYPWAQVHDVVSDNINN